MGSWKQPSLPQPNHVQVFNGGIAVVVPPLPLTIRAVSAVALSEVCDLPVHRSGDEQRLEGVRSEVALRIEAYQRLPGSARGKQLRK